MEDLEKYNLEAIRALETFLRGEKGMVTNIRILLGNSEYWYISRVPPKDEGVFPKRAVEEICPGWWRWTF